MSAHLLEKIGMNNFESESISCTGKINRNRQRMYIFKPMNRDYYKHINTTVKPVIFYLNAKKKIVAIVIRKMVFSYFRKQLKKFYTVLLCLWF